MKILVTGGAGYIGSHAVRRLCDAGHEVVVWDNLCHGHEEAIDPRARFEKLSLAETSRVCAGVQSLELDAVLHFAAYIEVGESVVEPLRYYQNNFVNALNLIEAVVEAKVPRFIFSSTAAVYGNPEETPIPESALRAPVNPYGWSKAMVEQALEDSSRAHGLGYAILRYFNVAGAHESGELGEKHEPESHLIPRILDGAVEDKPVLIYGTDYPTPDGTCIRDYVHVQDLVEAHVLALEKSAPGRGDLFNLGSEQGFSVREVISACEKVIGRKLNVIEEDRRPGDSAVLVADSQRARRHLGWKPRFPDLESIVAHAWAWHRAGKKFKKWTRD